MIDRVSRMFDKFWDCKGSDYFFDIVLFIEIIVRFKLGFFSVV